MGRFYRRHSPNEIPEGVPFFVTWNLKGALPTEARQRLNDERERLERQPKLSDESVRDRRIRESKIVFAMADRFLDAASSGLLHLKDSAASKIVEDAILFGAGERYELLAWCVMANHVHILLKPLWKLEKILQGMKGYTAYGINALQNQRGRTLWQDESFVHWVRDEEELARIIHYIENNPVAAGLCAKPEEWSWSSARFRKRWPVGRPFQADSDGSIPRDS